MSFYEFHDFSQSHLKSKKLYSVHGNIGQPSLDRFPKIKKCFKTMRGLAESTKYIWSYRKKVKRAYVMCLRKFCMGTFS